MQMNGSEMKKDDCSESEDQGWMLASSKFTWRGDFDLMLLCCLKMESIEAHAILHTGICCDLYKGAKKVARIWRMQK